MSDKLFTRKLSRLGNTLVRATLQDDRVFIEKIFFAEFGDVDFTRRAAGREADTMRRLAVRRDEDGRAVSNNDFLFDCQVENGADRTVLRMDTVAGWTLAEYRARWRNGVRPWPDSFSEEELPLSTYLERVLEIISETAYALQAIHQARPGTLHCDIKPTNIWVLAGQHPVQRMAGIRLIDLGSAFVPQSLAPGQSPRALLERYGHVCGTPGFWTGNLRTVGEALRDLQEALDCRLPEEDLQARADVCLRALQALSPADDIYALTVSLYWALTGQTAEGQSEKTLRQTLDQELAELPFAVRRAVTDFLLEQMAYCSGAAPDDCDAHFIRALETLQQIIQCTGLHPESLRLCAQQWAPVWASRYPFADHNYIRWEDLPYLSSQGGLLDMDTLSWMPQDWKKTDTLETWIRKGTSFSIQGIPGMGTTCLLRHTYCELLEDPGIIPLYLPLDRFDPTVPDALLRFIGENYLTYLQEDVPDAPAALRRLFANETRYRFCVFLDHLDPALCAANSSLYNQIRELMSYACVQVVTAGHQAPDLGLPVRYTVFGLHSPPAVLPSLKEGNWFRRLARFRLCLSALNYQSCKFYAGLLHNQRNAITAMQLQILALWQRCARAPAGIEPDAAREMLLSCYLPLCAWLYREKKTRFLPPEAAAFLPRQKEQEEDFFRLCLYLELMTRTDAGYAIVPDQRDAGAALYYADESHYDELRRNLSEGKTDPERLLLCLAELDPGHPIPVFSGVKPLPEEAWGFLRQVSAPRSVLNRLEQDILRAPAAQPDRLLNALFQAWAYERGGDLSGCDLRNMSPEHLTLSQTRLLGPDGPALLPRGLSLTDVAVLPLPPEIRWMDWRDGFLLLAAETRVAVIDGQERVIFLALPGDCRRILRAALCPDIGRVQVFYYLTSPSTTVCYQVFDLRTGALLPEKVSRFPTERMEELRECHLSPTEWLSSDKQNTLTIKPLSGTTVLWLAPRFLPDFGRVLWELLPYDAPLSAPLAECGDLRLENRNGRFLLYDVRQGPLWDSRRSRLWEILRDVRGPGLCPNLLEGTPVPLPDGFLLEFQLGIGLSIPGYEQEYWVIGCDTGGHPRSSRRYDMTKLQLLASERWFKDSTEEDKKAFRALEDSPAAPLNHRVYANGKLYLRSDLKPYLLLIWDLQAGKVERLITASCQIEAVVRDGDRVIAVSAGHKMGFLASGTVEEIRRTVPLNQLLSSYTRYIPHRGNPFVPCVQSPLLLEQAQVLLPAPEPGSPLQPDTLLHTCLDTETITL